MNVTVILCTYNRFESLAKALESVGASIVPPTITWEVLVVDNNSHDRTHEVVDEFCSRYPGRFRYLFEPKPGKSNALNSGIREARGNVLAFMDDDVTVEPTWLRNLTAPLQDGEWAGVGGRIYPERDFSPPRWLSVDGPYSMGGILALFDLGDTAGQLDRAPFGTNMAFQRKMFEKYGDFRTDMGPRPNSEIRNEDTEFGRRLMAAGERLWYEPSAVVHHGVPENRLRKEYFQKFWFDHGRAAVRELGRRPDIWGVPRPCLSILKMAILLVGRTLRWILTLNAKQKFYRKFWVWMTAGEIAEFYQQLLDSRASSESRS
ncbi:MAG: glycosyltransferase family 2 protein [Candidatus Acidiferrum sp.]